MHRLFVAIDLPDEAKNALGTLCSGVAGAKWVKREQMHLTLRFIGDADDAQFEAIKHELQSVKSAPFDMWLEGVGQFPAKGKPRVLWVGVKAPPVLAELQRQVSSTLNGLNLPPGDHPFSPHITLARLKTPPAAESVRQYFGKQASFKTETFPVQGFILFSSQLTPGGSIYRKEAVYSIKSD